MPAVSGLASRASWVASSISVEPSGWVIMSWPLSGTYDSFAYLPAGMHHVAMTARIVMMNRMVNAVGTLNFFFFFCVADAVGTAAAASDIRILLSSVDYGTEGVAFSRKEKAGSSLARSACLMCGPGKGLESKKGRSTGPSIPSNTQWATRDIASQTRLPHGRVWIEPYLTWQGVFSSPP